MVQAGNLTKYNNNRVAVLIAVKHVCMIYLRMGIDNSSIIQQYLINYGLNKISIRTVKLYIKEAKKELMNDQFAKAWLTNKVQQAQINDWIELYQEHDRLLQENKKMRNLVIQKAKQTAHYIKNDEKQFPTFLDYGAMAKLEQTQIQIMNSKRDLMETGLINFKVKRYLDTLQRTISGKPLDNDQKQDNVIMINAIKPPFGANRPLVQDIPEPEKEDPKLGFQLADHVKDIEKLIGKKSYSLEESE